MKKMKSTYKLKEAINKDEAIDSILDLVEENPVWLNKVNDSLFRLVQAVEPEHREFLLEKSIDEQVIDMFVKIKTEYYNFKDNTSWS